MQFVWPHEIAKNKMFRSMLLPKKVQEIHQKAAQILVDRPTKMMLMLEKTNN